MRSLCPASERPNAKMGAPQSAESRRAKGE